MSKYDEIKINDLHRDQNLAALAWELTIFPKLEIFNEHTIKCSQKFVSKFESILFNVRSPFIFHFYVGFILRSCFESADFIAYSKGSYWREKKTMFIHTNQP